MNADFYAGWAAGASCMFVLGLLLLWAYSRGWILQDRGPAWCVVLGHDRNMDWSGNIWCDRRGEEL